MAKNLFTHELREIDSLMPDSVRQAGQRYEAQQAALAAEHKIRNNMIECVNLLIEICGARRGIIDTAQTNYEKLLDAIRNQPRAVIEARFSAFVTPLEYKRKYASNVDTAMECFNTCVKLIK